jgi:hypothetical protein
MDVTKHSHAEDGCAMRKNIFMGWSKGNHDEIYQYCLGWCLLSAITGGLTYSSRLFLVLIFSQFALCGYDDDAMVPLTMFCKARRLQHSLNLGLGNLTTNYNITVNISHLNRQLSLYLRQRPSLFEVTSLPSTVKMKIPRLVGEHYLSDVFKRPGSSQ